MPFMTCIAVNQGAGNGVIVNFLVNKKRAPVVKYSCESFNTLLSLI